MAKKRADAPASPEIFEATLGDEGAVHGGRRLSQRAAEERRRNGLNVVVCGDDVAANIGLAAQIEHNANGRVMRSAAHVYLGRLALPHYQPDPRPPLGHTFYETPTKKSQF